MLLTLPHVCSLHALQIKAKQRAGALAALGTKLQQLCGLLHREVQVIQSASSNVLDGSKPHVKECVANLSVLHSVLSMQPRKWVRRYGATGGLGAAETHWSSAVVWGCVVASTCWRWAWLGIMGAQCRGRSVGSSSGLSGWNTSDAAQLPELGRQGFAFGFAGFASPLVRLLCFQRGRAHLTNLFALPVWCCRLILQGSPELLSAVGSHRVAAAEAVVHLAAPNNVLLDRAVLGSNLVPEVLSLALQHPLCSTLHVRSLQLLRNCLSSTVPDLALGLMQPGWGIGLQAWRTAVGGSTNLAPEEGEEPEGQCSPFPEVLVSIGERCSGRCGGRCGA